MIMTFKNPCATRQILEYGEVITLRKTVSTYSGDLTVHLKSGRTIPAYRTLLGSVPIFSQSGNVIGSHSCRKTLHEYLDKSGFDTISDWVKAAHDFSGDGIYQIFHVSRTDNLSFDNSVGLSI